MGRLDAAAQLQGLGALYPHRQRGVGAHMIGHCSAISHTMPCHPSGVLPRMPCAVPAGRALDAAEHLLVKCRPLKSQWGTERFGLADTVVLQAIEVRAGGGIG